MSRDQRTRRASEQELALWRAVNTDTVLSRMHETMQMHASSRTTPILTPRSATMARILCFRCALHTHSLAISRQQCGDPILLYVIKRSVPGGDRRSLM